MRFLRQPTSYTCVPVAIINALKFFGEKSTKEDIKFIKVLMGWGFDQPTDLNRVERVVKFLGKNVYKSKRVMYPGYRSIIKHLKTGYPIIFSFFVEDLGPSEYGHMVLMYMKDNKIYCVNENKSETITHISRFNLMFMKLRKTLFYPEAYFLWAL